MAQASGAIVQRSISSQSCLIFGENVEKNTLEIPVALVRDVDEEYGKIFWKQSRS